MDRQPTFDVHAHVFPRAAIDLAGSGREWQGSIIERDADGAPVTITSGRRQVYGSSLHFEPAERRVELMDEAGIDVEILSVLPPLFRYELPPAVGAAAASEINDDIAEWCRRWPDRFLGLATLPLQDPDAAMRELDRAMNELGLVGATIGTYVGDANLDDPALYPLFEAFAERGAFVLIHPASPRAGGTMPRYYLRNVIGNPWETAIAIGSLVFGGVLEQLPNLRVCCAHGGGYGPFAAGRMAHAFRARPEPRSVVSTAPRELLRQVYVDSLVHDDVALRYLIDTMGIQNVVLGSDFPSDMGPVNIVSEVADSGRLSDTEKAAILSSNALRLLVDLGHPSALALLSRIRA